MGNVTPTRPAATAMLDEEILNPLHQQAESNLAVMTAELAAEAISTAALKSAGDANDRELRQKAVTLAADDLIAERLRQDLEAARTSYDGALAEFQRANIRVAELAADLRLFEDVRASPRPIAPRKLRNLTFGALLGFVSGLFVTLVQRERDI
jgi:uncharacterized protein involved in exopolysaccharide biosynthesis